MDNADSGINKRKHKRVPVNFIIRYRIRKPLEVVMLIGGMEVNAVMVDLSEGGMAILTDYDIPVETELALKFTLVNTYTRDPTQRNKVVEALGCVTDVFLMDRANRLGIKFTEISNQHVIAITDFVNLAFRSSS